METTNELPLFRETPVQKKFEKWLGIFFVFWIGWVASTIHYGVPSIPWLQHQNHKLHVVQTEIPKLKQEIGDLRWHARFEHHHFSASVLGPTIVSPVLQAPFFVVGKTAMPKPSSCLTTDQASFYLNQGELIGMGLRSPPIVPIMP